ncbi:MAG: adenine methylase [Candidatus Methanomethylophilaceae archaeon]|nr:adenine methylase [Candidatus Methanomethylophilaceae archaeon]
MSRDYVPKTREFRKQPINHIKYSVILMRNGMNNIPRPILKWAGGKGSLITVYESMALIPETFDTYHEPFFGGGAVFFHLWKKGRIKKAIISDINWDVVNLYQVIKNDVDDLISELKYGNYPNEKDSFYNLRKEFNILKKVPLSDVNKADRVRRAALMIYLNRVCFNGLYRENKSGEFNVPFGRYKDPRILDEKNLLAVNKAFQVCEIKRRDFFDSMEIATKGDFVYLDPPYMPISITSVFSDYSKEGFGIDEQKRLAEGYRRLGERGVKALLSNSDHPEIISLYQNIPGVKIDKVLAARAINCKGDGRQSITELAISNYDLTAPILDRKNLSNYS